MKGLLLNIYRSDYDSKLNVFNGVRGVTLLMGDNFDGAIFEPSAEYPPARMVVRKIGGEEYKHIEPCNSDGTTTGVWYMDGGTIASCSDSRFRSVSRYPLCIHDRIEP